ncbi:MULTISPECIES: sugar phosphate nucleotidyltransferase [Thermoactinomyces]|jgi:glucose-1-phosphate thymidylyltransferase|uniref:Glucose-1-phosphate thymidylyltransferase n=1 Tax=Thermoactinomyces daqus TaxID=1329516 RepID=A0A7W2AIZ3_9BACL|nr:MULTISPECIES: sugar phosphate nucleotidyltransferase [Thermoactinomyces]MBA4543765.1 NTP transferase domain-containing protein [Thermoactinomyces daqus]MBH8598388.1 NTP transferase domain-containing protein [Thermoactinomyces sp. CICC 10523]MBH8604513.1 NTP transferase domain-containing protein [Thermoactinomyces sp. CICC 10522]MBH8607484.1 NTP transferase domain-containing protein [Thermoactinomyces sp. CICC 10521]
MKGIILAGGTGSRLFPLTKITNKHLLPVGRYPMIYHPVYKLVECGIRDILIVTGVEHMGDVVRLLGSGKQFSTRFTYKVQDEPGGIAQALSLAEDFAGEDRMVVLLGDNVFEDSLKPYVEAYASQGSGAKILLKKVNNPERFGVAEICGDQIVSIEEKPQRPKSSLCVTGIYMYDPQVFSFIRTLTPSGRGEYEITDVNNLYIRQRALTFDVLEGWWTDAGTQESLLRANQFAANVRYEL